VRGVRNACCPYEINRRHFGNGGRRNKHNKEARVNLCRNRRDGRGLGNRREQIIRPRKSRRTLAPVYKTMSLTFVYFATRTNDNARPFRI